MNTESFLFSYDKETIVKKKKKMKKKKMNGEVRTLRKKLRVLFLNVFWRPILEIIVCRLYLFKLG